MENKIHYFYVLQCSDGSFYAGYTNNLQNRLKLHNEGKGAKYTRGRGPVKLLYTETYMNKTDALKMEYQFKQWTRRKKELFLAEEMGGLDVETKKF